MEKIKYSLINEVKYEKVLDNGLRVIVIPKKGFLKFFASFTSGFGAFDTEYVSINSQKRIKIPHGVAHFLEHKMFEMPDGDDANSYLSDLGVDGNAFTDYNQTSYIISGTKNLEPALEYLLDFVQIPYFTDENIEKEKGIIIQEYKMYCDIPSDVLNKKLMENMYANISYNEDIVGNVDEINSINKEMLYDAYESFYHPSNMLLCIVGDFDVEKIIDLIEKNQAKKNFKKEYQLKRIYQEEENRIIKKYDEIKFDVVQPKVGIGIKLPQENYAGIDNMALEIKFKVILEMMLGSMSETYQEMLDKEYIGSNFRYNVRLDENSAYLKISTDTKKPNIFIEFILNILKNVNKHTFDKLEFETLKKAYWGSVLMSLNDVEYIGVSYPEYYFKSCDFFEAVEKLQDITYEEIYQLKKYFNEEMISTIVVKK